MAVKKKWRIIAEETVTMLGWLAIILATLNFFKGNK